MASLDLVQLLDGSIVSSTDGSGFLTKHTSAEVVLDKPVALYFSAGWCNPCKGFTPVLRKAYEEQQSQDRRIEIIFVSSDHDEDAFLDYYSHMPWKAVDYERDDVRETLKATLNIKSLPTLVVLGKNGQVLTTNGRAAIETNAAAALAEWAAC